MGRIDEILQHNKKFVANGEYKSLETSKYPNKKIAILTCMDTRLTYLLPEALGIKNGDVKMIKNAGAMISHPYGSVMRSLMVSIYELGIEEIFVIGHYDCGMQHLSCEEITKKMLASGISKESIEEVKKETDYERWLSGFDNVEEAVKNTVLLIKNHKLISKDIKVYGLVMDPITGKVDNLKV